MAAGNEKHWFVAFVTSCQERRVAEYLGRLGYECWVPIQKEIHKWSDRKKVVDRVVISGLVFVHSTEFERYQSLGKVPGLRGYLNSGEGPGHPGIVKDAEMEAFRTMVEKGNGSVTVTGENFSPGDHVRIIDGPLEGMECEMVTVGATRCIVVRLGALGTARMDIDISTVRKL